MVLLARLRHDRSGPTAATGGWLNLPGGICGTTAALEGVRPYLSEPRGSERLGLTAEWREQSGLAAEGRAPGGGGAALLEPKPREEGGDGSRAPGLRSEVVAAAAAAGDAAAVVRQGDLQRQAGKSHCAQLAAEALDKADGIHWPRLQGAVLIGVGVVGVRAVARVTDDDAAAVVGQGDLQRHHGQGDCARLAAEALGEAGGLRWPWLEAGGAAGLGSSHPRREPVPLQPPALRQRLRVGLQRLRGRLRPRLLPAQVLGKPLGLSGSL